MTAALEPPAEVVDDVPQYLFPISDWHDCYGDSWKDLIVPEAFAHPAKFSKALIERIVDHGLARGYWQREDLIGDPFGGIGLGGIAYAYRGLHWIGCELEPKFVKLAGENFELHRAKLAQLGKPLPRIIQGDSRKFDVNVDAAITSPPYAETHVAADDNPYTNTGGKSLGESRTGHLVKSGNYGNNHGQIGALKSGAVDAVMTSPPYAGIASGAGGLNTKPAKDGQQGGRNPGTASQDTDQRYGESAGQIARLAEGNVDAVVTSPPYNLPVSQTHNGSNGGTRGTTPSEDGAFVKYGNTAGQIEGMSNGTVDAVITSPPFSAPGMQPVIGQGTREQMEERGRGRITADGYGATEGQIAALKPGEVDGVVTSPPWENNSEGGVRGSKVAFIPDNGKGHYASPEAKARQLERDEQKIYGESDGQIGNDKGETYWQAMALVYAACFRAMKPGGVLACVVKDYVQKGKRVPLCDDTLRLLNHCGFVTLERVRAMLVRHRHEVDLFNGNVTITKSRKSFFRRLCEKKGSPAIDFEEVLFVFKPCAEKQ